MGSGDHLHFLVIAHPGCLQVGAHHPIEQTNRREVLYTREANRGHLLQEVGHDTKGIRAVYASQHRGVAHHWQHFAGHFHHDGVGIAVGHEARQRTAPGHAVAPRVVDDDQISAACFLKLGRDTRASAHADDGTTRRHFCVQTSENDFACEFHTACPRVVDRCGISASSALAAAWAKASSLMSCGISTTRTEGFR